MTTAGYLAYQRQQLLFRGFVILLTTIVVIVGTAVYFAAVGKVNDSPAVSIGTPGAQPFRVLIALLEQEYSVTVEVGSSCGADLTSAIIDQDTHNGKDPKDFLEKLRYRSKPVLRYNVETSGATNEHLKIICY